MVGSSPCNKRWSATTWSSAYTSPVTYRPPVTFAPGVLEPASVFPDVASTLNLSVPSFFIIKASFGLAVISEPAFVVSNSKCPAEKDCMCALSVVSFAVSSNIILGSSPSRVSLAFELIKSVLA